ncbi:MAG: 2-phospho-L-lactate guanylyltransferase, partial [Nitrososphaera sp.]
MKIFAIVPVKKFENSKTRLSSMLSPEDRLHLSSVMLEETLHRLAAAASGIQKIIVVSSDERARKIAASHDAVFQYEEKDSGVNSAVKLGEIYSTVNGADACLVVPQDLPLLDPQEVSAFCDLARGEERCVVICPSQRYDGTNLLLRKPPAVMPTFFDQKSYENHLASAKERGIPVRIFATRKLMLDIDTPDDVRMLLGDSSLQESEVLEFLRGKDVE